MDAATVVCPKYCQCIDIPPQSSLVGVGRGQEGPFQQHFSLFVVVIKDLAGGTSLCPATSALGNHAGMHRHKGGMWLERSRLQKPGRICQVDIETGSIAPD